MKDRLTKTEARNCGGLVKPKPGNSLSDLSAFSLTRLETVGDMDAAVNDSLASRRRDQAKDTGKEVGNSIAQKLFDLTMNQVIIVLCHSSINLPSALNACRRLCAFSRTVTHRAGGFSEGVTMRDKEKVKSNRRRFTLKHGYGDNSEWRSRRVAMWRLRNPEKYRVSQIVKIAIKGKKLIRPDSCSRCFCACKPQAHHEDYSKPLDVIWLCFHCHLKAHGKKPLLTA